MSWLARRGEKTRLCFVGWGDHVHTERWVAQYVRDDFDVCVVSLSGRGRYPDPVRQFSLPTMPVADWRIRRLWLRVMLSILAPDIVHIQYAGFLLVVRPIWLGPLVVTVWGSDIYKAEAELTTAECARLAEYLRGADCITCDSEDLASSIAAFCGPGHPEVAIVQWGVDTQQFTPAATPSRFAQELGLADKSVFLSPRSFTPLYRLTDIIAAFARVAAELPQAHLLMKRYNAVPSYAEEVERLINVLNLGDRVTIIDRIDYEDMVEYYRTGSTMVSVPESDGTPMSLLEGMACGCYPIVSDLPSLREWITDGENGRLVPVGDVGRLAEAMLAVAREQARGGGLEAALVRNRTLVEARASQAANQETMLACYAKLSEASEHS